MNRINTILTQLQQQFPVIEHMLDEDNFADASSLLDIRLTLINELVSLMQHSELNHDVVAAVDNIIIFEQQLVKRIEDDKAMIAGQLEKTVLGRQARDLYNNNYK